MFSKHLIIIATVLLVNAYAVVLSPGLCESKMGVRGSFIRFDFKLWYHLSHSDPLPQARCEAVRTITFQNETTYIFLQYINTSSNELVYVMGTQQNNEKTGQFTLSLAGFPPDGYYWNIDFTPKVATFYVCVQISPTEKAESAFIIISSLEYEKDPEVLSRGVNALRANGFDTTALVPADNHRCNFFVAPPGVCGP